VELSGVEGLCHISEISWEKVDDPSLLYKVGQKVKVKVLEVDPAQNKLALSIKALLSNPWQEVAKKYKVGERITGTVSKVVPFGAFVLLEPGLEGLIHVSETIGPLKVGEKVEAEIITVEPDKQKLGLSVRKLKEVMVTYK
jgi:ribosomal protein S1